MFATIVEKRAGVRFHLARFMGPVYRRAFAHFGRGSVLIAPTMLQHVRQIWIGAGNLFRDGAWLACEQPMGRLTTGVDNYFGHRVHLHAGDPITIGSHCTFADNVFVASVDHGNFERDDLRRSGPIVIGDRVFVGQNAVILGGVIIGDGAIVGAGAVVTKDVDPGTVVVGVPAKPLRRP